jgi:carboxypeptidase Q
VTCAWSAAVVALVACAPEPAPRPSAAWIADTSPFVPTRATPIADRYRAVAQRILAAARADRGAYAKLQELTDRVGHRLSGSPELTRAIAWAVSALAADGLDARAEKVMVPHWVRGAEDAALVAPNARPLHVIGLGGTVATPRAGLDAPIVVVRSWQELEAAGDRVKGAIVLYDVAMPAYTEERGTGYGQVVQFRTQGAVRAAKQGAVAVLMRSVTAKSLGTPHTGAMAYDDKVTKIPAAAITIEDTDLLARLAKRGPVVVHLHLESQQLPDAESANVIGELRGREHPEEIVVIGGHIDSWDVGQGAHDDGAGIVTMMEALAVLKKLGLEPRRTIRAVLFTNEENGLRGGRGYAEQHKDELARTVLALESDTGGFSPRGFTLGHVDAAALARMRARVADFITLLAPLNATRLTAEGHAGGADISPLAPAGVPQVGLDVDVRTYFDIHHTEADTLDKVDPAQLADDVAAVAVFAYVVADLPERVDAP